MRGRIAIHAAKSLSGRHDHDADRLARAGLEWSKLPFGAIIGTVDIVDCIPTEQIANSFRLGKLEADLLRVAALPITYTPNRIVEVPANEGR